MLIVDKDIFIEIDRQHRELTTNLQTLFNTFHRKQK